MTSKFVKSVEPIMKDGNIVGYEITYVEIDGGELKTSKECFYNQISVVPKYEDGVWRWYIRTLQYDETGKVILDQNGHPLYADAEIVNVDGNQFIPRIAYYNGKLYVSKPGASQNIAEDVGKLDQYWEEIVEIRDVNTGGSTEQSWITGVTNNSGEPYVSINFKDGSSIKIRKYVDEPVIKFVASENDTNIEITSFTVPDGHSSGTVTFTISGSFIGEPTVKAVCEGNWTSANVDVVTFSEGTDYIGTVEVHPWTAYATCARRSTVVD